MILTPELIIHEALIICESEKLSVSKSSIEHFLYKELISDHFEISKMLRFFNVLSFKCTWSDCNMVFDSTLLTFLNGQKQNVGHLALCDSLNNPREFTGQLYGFLSLC